MTDGLPFWLKPIAWALVIIGLPIRMLLKAMAWIEDKLGDWIG